MNLEITYNEDWLRTMNNEISNDEIKKDFHVLEKWRKYSEDTKRELREKNSEENWYPYFDKFNEHELEFLNMWKDKMIKIDQYQNHLEVVEEINSLLSQEYPRNTTHLNELTDNIIKTNIETELYFQKQKEVMDELKRIQDSIPDEEES